jgi:hypothetical protein
MTPILFILSTQHARTTWRQSFTYA